MSRRPDLATAAAAGPVVLDGGLATLLEARGHDLGSELWSARLLREDPGAVRAAHGEFFAAGAQVAISASYQVSYDGLSRAGASRAETDRLLRTSVTLAAEARDEAAPDGWVAASVGPYGAALADGSEYRGDYDLDVASLRAWHRPRLAVLAGAGADVLALETVPCLAEVEALLAEVAGTGHPVWLAVTADGDRTRAGEPLSEAFAMAADVAEVVAVGVNCTSPRGVPAALAQLPAGVTGVAYPNSGESWDAGGRRWRGTSALTGDAGAERVATWLDAGARLVGGCCRVGPDGVRALASGVAAGRRERA